MPDAFNFSASPFHSLSSREQSLVRDHVDIVYFRPDEVILEVGAAPQYLYIVIKGQVAQMEGSTTLHIYAPEDAFDGRGLVAGHSSHRFVAQEEVLAYALDYATVRTLIANNATFSALLFSSLGGKLQALSQHPAQHEMQSLTLARVDAAMLRTPHYVDAGTPVTDVARVLHEQRISHVLVRDDAHQPPRLGIFSANDLPAAILHGLPLDALPVGQLATFGLITIRPEQPMGDALTTMLRHRIHRVVVSKGEQVHGVVESLDVFSYLSNHSHLILTRIDQAQDLNALVPAATQTTRMVEHLYRSGTDVGLIGRLVQQVNIHMFERVWQLVAPEDLQTNACLIVMGSEGRGEQLLKTDQDNALIWRDGYTPPADLQHVCNQFADALALLGYPPCPGNIMLRNAAWRGSVQDWHSKIRHWLARGNAQDMIDLAIFLDAHAAAGDSSLLEDVRSYLWQATSDNDVLLTRFAAATEAFGSAQDSWLNRLFAAGDAHQLLHIKKLGLFPIVHGVRSLALSERIAATSTVERIEALVQSGTLQRKWGDNLIHSLHFFMALRLKANLANPMPAQDEVGDIDVRQLTSLERDLLKDALGIVKRLKTLVHQRFRLNLL